MVYISGRALHELFHAVVLPLQQRFHCGHSALFTALNCMLNYYSSIVIDSWLLDAVVRYILR